MHPLNKLLAYATPYRSDIRLATVYSVLNKFFDTEARINTLLDILSKFEFDHESLSEKSRDMLQKWEKEP